MLLLIYSFFNILYFFNTIPENIIFFQGVIIVYQLESAWDWWRNVSIDLCFVSAFLCEPNSVIKFSRTGIWIWCRKRPPLLSCPAENYSNLNFNEHEKAGNEVALNWRFFCSILVYASLHFLPILLVNQCFIVLRLLCFPLVLCRIWYNLNKRYIHLHNFCLYRCQVICVFVLFYEKQFVHVIKVWVQFLIKKTCL